MSKARIARVFLASIGAVLLGLLLALASGWLGDAAQVNVLEDGEIVGLDVQPLGYLVVALAAAAATALLAGALALVVAWAAALANARAAERRGWFAWLVMLGVPTLGVGALVAYLVAGPDRVASSA